MDMNQPAVMDGERPPSEFDAIAARQYLCLAVGKETYAVGIDVVREILEMSRMTPLPLTPDFVRGVMNLRGAVVPVIDLKARFGDEPSVIGRRSSVVIVETGHHDQDQDGPLVVGVLVDGVSEVLEIAEQDIEPVPMLGTRIPREFLQGMAKAKGILLSILDADRILEREAMAALIAGHMAH